MKVDQQSHGNIEQPKVREQLSDVYRAQSFLALGFDHHAAFDHNVSAETAVQLHAVVYQRDRLLPFDAQAKFRDFVRQAAFVR